jgi:hypothetical protein
MGLAEAVAVIPVRPPLVAVKPLPTGPGGTVFGRLRRQLLNLAGWAAAEEAVAIVRRGGFVPLIVVDRDGHYEVAEDEDGPPLKPPVGKGSGAGPIAVVSETSVASEEATQTAAMAIDLVTGSGEVVGRVIQPYETGALSERVVLFNNRVFTGLVEGSLSDHQFRRGAESHPEGGRSVG